MQGADDLHAIAEFAIGLAGFSAIALMLGSRDSAIAQLIGLRSRGLDRSNASVVRSMIISALAPGFLAFVPLLMFHFGLDGPNLWRISSTIFIIGAIAIAWPITRLQHRHKANPEGGYRPKLLPPLLWSLLLLALLSNLINVTGIPLASAVGPYLLGLWLTLLISGVQFVIIVFNVLH